MKTLTCADIFKPPFELRSDIPPFKFMETHEEQEARLQERWEAAARRRELHRSYMEWSVKDADREDKKPKSKSTFTRMKWCGGD